MKLLRTLTAFYSGVALHHRGRAMFLFWMLAWLATAYAAVWSFLRGVTL